MTGKKWTIDEAKKWFSGQPWLRGCNFYPSTAINQLEMWQEESFDPKTIDRELGWAADLGFNVMRVYLHDMVWYADPDGFKKRIDEYLRISAKHGIKTIFVLFDDCWHDEIKLGPQPKPKPGIHNPGWLQGPGRKVLQNKDEWGRLEEYVKDIIGTYAGDARVIMWDIYNEPGNNFLVSLNLPVVVRYVLLIGKLVKHLLVAGPSRDLLVQAFGWAREANPTQPLTAGLYFLKPSIGAKLNPLSLELSDVVSFHSYFNPEDTQALIDMLKPEGRPMICTEYLARGTGNTFQAIMPLFKQDKIGAINWGLVAGKTQTMYSWEDFYPNGEEPPLWYHDVLRPDGTSYKEEEKKFIQKITKGG